MVAKKRVVALISGSGTNLQALIDASAMPDYPAEIVGVISNKADAYGLRRAQKAGITTRVIDHKLYKNREQFDTALHEVITEWQADIVCLAGFMRLLTPAFVEKWRGRMLNIHPSLLPAFKGGNAHRDAIEAGVRITGCTAHFVVPEMDAGPIIVQGAVPVYADDTVDTLRERLLPVEHRVYQYALKQLASDSISIDKPGTAHPEDANNKRLFSFD